MSRDRAQSDGFLLLCLGALIFAATGLILIKAQGGMGLDFRMVHGGARAVLEHRDPYRQADLLGVYQEDGGAYPPNCCYSVSTLLVETRYVYLPTIFAVSGPLGVLPLHVAFVIWTLLAAAGYFAAAWMMWNVGKAYSPRLAGALLGLTLANSGTLISTGNAATVAIACSIIAAWCFISERAIPFGIVCMIASLALKPHDSALIWLALFLCGGMARKRAVQSAAAFAVVELLVLAWVWHISPNWFSEIRANVADLLAPGGMDDPGPANVLSRGTMTYTNLQSVVSLLKDDPHFYNLVTYAIGLLVIALFAFIAIRHRNSAESRWIAVAFAAAFTLVPFYHRHYDAKLLLLTVPACMLLLSRTKLMGKVGLVVTTCGLVIASDLIWAIYIALTRQVQFTGLLERAYFYSRALPVPCAVAGVALFYLIAYAKWLGMAKKADLAAAEWQQHRTQRTMERA